MDIDAKTEVARVSVGAGLVTLWGMTMSDIAAVLTALYMLVQIVILAPKAWDVVKRVFQRE